MKVFAETLRQLFLFRYSLPKLVLNFLQVLISLNILKKLHLRSEINLKQRIMAKKKKPTDHGLENVENVLSKTEKYIEENQKSLTIIVIVIAAIIGGYLGYKKLFLEPTELEAQSEMYVAEKYFEADSFLLALEGDGSYLGFIDIIDEYGITKCANLAKYYETTLEVE